MFYIILWVKLHSGWTLSPKSANYVHIFGLACFTVERHQRDNCCCSSATAPHHSKESEVICISRPWMLTPNSVLRIEPKTFITIVPTVEPSNVVVVYCDGGEFHIPYRWRADFVSSAVQLQQYLGNAKVNIGPPNTMVGLTALTTHKAWVSNVTQGGQNSKPGLSHGWISVLCEIC